MALFWPPAVFRYFGHSNRKSVFVYNHPWTVVLLALTHLIKDAERDSSFREALDLEGGDLLEKAKSLRDGLESITDVSFRDYESQ